MSLSAESKSPRKNKVDIPDAGTHMARLVGLTDIGHQPGFIWKDKKIDSSYKITFTYELVNSLMEDGRPHWVSEDVNVNDFEGDGIRSTMMARVRCIDPENESNNGKDLSKLINKPCMVTIIINDNGYPKLIGQTAVSGIPIGMEVPVLQNNTFIFDMDAPDMDVYESFSEFAQGKLKAAINFDQSELAKELAVSDEY